jgi:hypothetical protein
MTQNRKPEKCPSDRLRDRTGEFLVGTLSLAMGVLAVYWCKPEGMVAGIIIFGVAYFVTDFLHPIFWALLPTLLSLLGAVIILHTISLASQSGIPAMVAAMFLPVVAQAYWIWVQWADTGTLFHALPLLCAAWLILFGLWLLTRTIFTDWLPQQSKGGTTERGLNP